MKPEDFESAVDEMARQSKAMAPRIQQALRNLEDWSGRGYPSGGGDGRGGSSDTPTERAALSGHSDQYAAEHALVTESLVTAQLALRKAYRIVMAATNKTTANAGAGCFDCSRVINPRTRQPHANGWQARYVERPRPQNPEGQKVAYCSWHNDFIESYGEEPTDELILAHLDGQYVTQRLVRELAPELFARAQAAARVKPAKKDRMFGVANLGLRTSKSPESPAAPDTPSDQEVLAT